MAGTISVTCPACETTIKAAAEIEGKKVRCKSCSEIFVAKAAKPGGPQAVAAKPAAKAAPKPAKPEPSKAPIAFAKDDDEDDGKAYGITTEDTSHRCPHCANELASAEAVVCHHCGYDVMKREQHRTRVVHDTTGGDVFMWLLPGILCAVGIILLIVWDLVYCLTVEDWISGDSWIKDVLASRGVKLWMCIITIFVMVFLGQFAVRRLIFDNVPPEIETKA